MALEIGDKIKLIGKIKSITYEDVGSGDPHPKRVVIKLKLPGDKDFGGGNLVVDAELAELAKMSQNEPE